MEFDISLYLEVGKLLDVFEKGVFDLANETSLFVYSSSSGHQKCSAVWAHFHLWLQYVSKVTQ